MGMGLAVGLVVVSQILFSDVQDHLRECRGEYRVELGDRAQVGVAHPHETLQVELVALELDVRRRLLTSKYKKQ